MSTSASILLDFAHQVRTGRSICVMPIPRLRLESVCRGVAGCNLYPAGAIELAELNIVSYPAYEFSETIRRGYGDVAWTQSGATQITPEDFAMCALIVTEYPIDFGTLFESSHEYHKALIAEIAETFESALDLIRFNYCRLDLADTLPGRVGMMENSESFSAALFYSTTDHESYILGAQLITHRIVGGLGLELLDNAGPMDLGRGEVGNIARHGLTLMSAAMEANTLTSKFVQSFSALEYLSDPENYSKMEHVKTHIALHNARSKSDYLDICEDIRKLTSFKENGIELGYRTLIVHQGKRFEEIVPAINDQRRIFQRLQRYIGKILHDLIKMSSDDWSEVHNFRTQRRNTLGV